MDQCPKLGTPSIRPPSVELSMSSSSNKKTVCHPRLLLQIWFFGSLSFFLSLLYFGIQIISSSMATCYRHVSSGAFLIRGSRVFTMQSAPRFEAPAGTNCWCGRCLTMFWLFVCPLPGSCQDPSEVSLRGSGGTSPSGKKVRKKAHAKAGGGLFGTKA